MGRTSPDAPTVGDADCFDNTIVGQAGAVSTVRDVHRQLDRSAGHERLDDIDDKFRRSVPRRLRWHAYRHRQTVAVCHFPALAFRNGRGLEPPSLTESGGFRDEARRELDRVVAIGAGQCAEAAENLVVEPLGDAEPLLRPAGRLHHVVGRASGRVDRTRHHVVEHRERCREVDALVRNVDEFAEAVNAVDVDAAHQREVIDAGHA